MRSLSSLLLGIALSAMCAAANAQSWDLPSAYAPSNFHTVNLEKFAEGVKNATGGKLSLKVHGGYQSPRIENSRAIPSNTFTYRRRHESC